MSIKFQVNLEIASGTYFYQTFFITNPDFSPVDLTGATVYAAIAKHSSAVIATKVMNGMNSAATSLTAGVVDPTSGQYYIEMSAEETDKLEEGKYVYNVVIETPAPERRLVEATGGLAFVNKAFGFIRNQETDEV